MECIPPQGTRLYQQDAHLKRHESIKMARPSEPMVVTLGKCLGHGLVAFYFCRVGET